LGEDEDYLMSTAYTDPLSSYLCNIGLYNELQTAFNDWKVMLDQATAAMFAENDPWQKHLMWRNWQEWLEANCVNFVDEDDPINADGSAKYYTLATWRVKAGLNASGFTRKYSDGAGGVTTAYGLAQVDDYISPITFYELQHGFEISDEEIPPPDPPVPPDPPDPPTPRFVYKMASATASCVSVSSGKVTAYGTETWFPASSMTAFVKASIDGTVTALWPQGSGGPCVGAGTYLDCYRTESFGGARSGGVEAGEGTYTVTLTAEELVGLTSAQLVLMVSGYGGTFDAYQSGLTYGLNFMGEYSPDGAGVVETDTIGNVDGILGGSGVSWCDVVFTSGYTEYAGDDYYWERETGSKGFTVVGAAFLLKYEMGYGTYE